MKKLTLTALLVAPMMLAGMAQAADPAAGQAKAAVCMACHGADGIGVGPEWPNLKGQKELYLIKQMRAFRDGTRSDPLMSAQAAGLSDEDIEDLAAYYSGL